MTIVTKPNKVLKLQYVSTTGIELAISRFGGERSRYVTTVPASRKRYIIPNLSYASKLQHLNLKALARLAQRASNQASNYTNSIVARPQISDFTDKFVPLLLLKY